MDFPTLEECGIKLEPHLPQIVIKIETLAPSSPGNRKRYEGDEDDDDEVKSQIMDPGPGNNWWYSRETLSPPSAQPAPEFVTPQMDPSPPSKAPKEKGKGGRKKTPAQPQTKLHKFQTELKLTSQDLQIRILKDDVKRHKAREKAQETRALASYDRMKETYEGQIKRLVEAHSAEMTRTADRHERAIDGMMQLKDEIHKREIDRLKEIHQR